MRSKVRRVPVTGVADVRTCGTFRPLRGLVTSTITITDTATGEVVVACRHLMRWQLHDARQALRGIFPPSEGFAYAIDTTIVE